DLLPTQDDLGGDTGTEEFGPAPRTIRHLSGKHVDRVRRGNGIAHLQEVAGRLQRQGRGQDAAHRHPGECEEPEADPPHFWPSPFCPSSCSGTAPIERSRRRSSFRRRRSTRCSGFCIRSDSVPPRTKASRISYAVVWLTPYAAQISRAGRTRRMISIASATFSSRVSLGLAGINGSQEGPAERRGARDREDGGGFSAQRSGMASAAGSSVVRTSWTVPPF